MLEENFRRAMLLSRGDLMIYLERPISATFIFLSLALVLLQFYSYLRLPLSPRPARAMH
jgi:TctA family transporter